MNEQKFAQSNSLPEQRIVINFLSFFSSQLALSRYARDRRRKNIFMRFLREIYVRAYNVQKTRYPDLVILRDRRFNKTIILTVNI